ncbi:MAG TPA: GNAT family N-acetyltransferase [Woeseiaceae bacterium]|nr:GNAT family N-acetyltransferase [Woeseiaceae bacterium]
MRVSIHESIAEIPPAEWDRLAGEGIPFLKHAFLLAAENSGSVSPAMGWHPQHLALRREDGALAAVMPLYRKDHSWGEFVFDWAWASAYRRAGLEYYPKLVSAVPFTPASCPKLLRADPRDEAAGAALLAAARTLAGETGCSSAHLLFPADAELATAERSGFRLRKDCQFHWHNRGYSGFEDFLAGFSSAKRKKARRDRRRVAEAGIRFRRLTGRELDASGWRVVYDLISRTFAERGSLPYFNREFFAQWSAAAPDDILVVQAERDAAAVAAAVFFVGRDTLYGRYWGSDGHYDALHFETCYYQGIDYCIEHGLGRFEPGTQGEHKLSRGFVPSATFSAHWLLQPEFHAAVGDYVATEAGHVERYMDEAARHGPYRRDGNG